MEQNEWWRGAIIYQVYPRSFYDSNGDGIGDLRGVIDKFSYIESLGVDAVWLSPFFTSPMKDFGYDISNPCDVDPIFGNLDDFDELLAVAHKAGIKIIIDQVLSHCSDQHPWFEESRQSKNNDKADWFVWADPKPDGTPPNNWLSIFGGSAWQWDSRRKQYYLHNFLASQPDVNMHNTEARQAVLNNIEFWLKRGVDGFRLDAVNYCMHDKLLRDNPPRPEFELGGAGFSSDNPYAYQYHTYSTTRPENISFIEEIRQLTNRYSNRATLGEIGADDSLATMAQYTQGESRLNMAYSFELLNENFTVTYIRETIEKLEQQIGNGWPCWALGNHDVARVLTRWGKHDASDNLAKTLTAMVCSLRGSVCLYQGEELGLTEAELSFEQLQDPYGIEFWPKFKGRDGCRTPMPWQKSAKNGGFSTASSWLPVVDEHHARAVDVQHQCDYSILSVFRQFMGWRKQQPALIYGDISFIDLGQDVLAFVRHYQNDKILCVFNLSVSNKLINITDYQGFDIMSGHGLLLPTLNNDQLILGAHDALFAKI